MPSLKHKRRESQIRNAEAHFYSVIEGQRFGRMRDFGNLWPKCAGYAALQTRMAPRIQKEELCMSKGKIWHDCFARTATPGASIDREWLARDVLRLEVYVMDEFCKSLRITGGNKRRD